MTAASVFSGRPDASADALKVDVAVSVPPGRRGLAGALSSSPACLTTATSTLSAGGATEGAASRIRRGGGDRGMAAVGEDAFAAALAAGEGQGDHESGSVASWIGLHT